MIMINRLKDKLVVITGATSGIGKAAAELFAQAGCTLIITGRREERLTDVKSSLKNRYGVRVHTTAFDVRNREQCITFVQSITGKIDILINNAGLAKGADAIYNANIDDWDMMIDTNIKGLLTMTRYISERMKAQGEGHIINIGSTAGHEAYAGGSVYCATKFAVNAITQAAKKDLHGSGVRVSMISPGMTETEFSNVRFNGDAEKADSVYKGMKPLSAEDIAEIIHFTANRPDHVNILDTIIQPTAQSSATMVHRENT